MQVGNGRHGWGLSTDGPLGDGPPISLADAQFSLHLGLSFKLMSFSTEEMLAVSVWEAERGEEGVRHHFQYVACHLILCSL